MILITEEQLGNRVKTLAQEISLYSQLQEIDLLYLIFVLDGAFMFAADLARELDRLKLPLIIGSLKVNSYIGKQSTIKNPPIHANFDYSLENKSVLLVEDIIDTGLTINALKAFILLQKPKHLEFCVLLRKTVEREFAPNVKFIGFDIPNTFVVGYGLDYNGKFREKANIESY
jgi:hypoxanthine phosphoribosyltransferase